MHQDPAREFRGQGGDQLKEFRRGLIAQEPDFHWQLARTFSAGALVAAAPL